MESGENPEQSRCGIQIQIHIKPIVANNGEGVEEAMLGVRILAPSCLVTAYREQSSMRSVVLRERGSTRDGRVLVARASTRAPNITTNKHTSMKQTMLIVCSLALAPLAPAALNFTPSFSGLVYHTHSNADAISGFDWADDGNAYYATSTPSFNSGGLYRKNGAASDEIVAGSGSLFSGSSVVAIGSTVYHNDSDFTNQYIRTYHTGTAAITSTIVTNQAFGTDGTNLFTTGSADFMTTDLSYFANGVLSSSLSLGGIAGASGPVAIDAAGNLFYAPGFGDLSIYRWDAADVAAAIIGGPQLTATESLFADYSLAFASMSGATSMAIDAAGNLFVTLTNFSDPSNLVRFDASGTVIDLVATSTERLGGLNFHDGQLYVASGNQIFSVIPEPSALLLSLFATLPFVARRRR